MAFVIEKYRRYFSDLKWKRGKEYFQKRRVTIVSIDSGYVDSRENAVYDVVAKVTSNRGNVYDVSLLLDENEIIDKSCNCPDFSGGYRYWTLAEGCKHIAATVFEFVYYASMNNFENQSSKTAINLIDTYTTEKLNKVYAKSKEERIDIVPKLELTGKYPKVSFKIGCAKKYVIKDLYLFEKNMDKGALYSYGQNLEFHHNIKMFSDTGKKYARFILSRIKESNIFSANAYGFRSTSDKRAIVLTPHYFDSFFEIAKEEKIEVVNGRYLGDKTNVRHMSCVKENPSIKIFIKKYIEKTGKNKNNDIVGIKVFVEDIEYIEGEEFSYIVKEDLIYQVNEKFKNAMDSFLSYSLNKKDEGIVIDKKDIGVFYSRVISVVGKYADIIEEEGMDIAAYLLSEPEFKFYFDTKEKNIICQCIVNYGEKKYSIAEYQQDEKIRDIPKEFEVTYLINSYLPYYDPEIDSFHLDKDENKIYRLLESGMSAFMEIGEVNVTEEFKRIGIKKSPQISVGVSIESDLLNLSFQSEDFDLSELSEVLGSYRLKKKFHRLKSGDFISIDGNSLETLSELVDSLKISVKELTKGKMKIPMYRALYLDKMLQEGEDVEYERDSKFKALLRNFKVVEESDYQIPKEIANVLRNYQKTGYRWLRTIEEYGFGGILADDMGLGKTIQVITLILGTYKNTQEDKANISLVVCPASLVYNWQNEFNRFAKDIRVATVTGTATERKDIIANYCQYDVLVTSYDLLKRDIESYEDIVFQYEIIDEAQNIKNYTTQNAKAVKIVKASNKLALTGTPIENRLSELWSIFDYLMPGFLFSYDRFKKEFESPIAKNMDEKASNRLKKMVRPFILRRLKQDVLKDLPAKIEQNTYAKLEGEQQKLYDAYVLRIKENLQSQTADEFEKNKFRVLAELTRIRQICCDPRLCFSDYTKESAKLDTCMELVESAINGGHKLLIFSQFTSMLEIIGQRLVESGIGYYEITGATPKEKRVKLVDKFNLDATPVFLISLKAGGTGLNLTGADIVIHYDPWWNVAAQNQATDRAHRIGQSKVVTVFKIIAKGTIEEKILEMQKNKMDLANQIISGETNNLAKMSKDEFLELL